MIVKVIFFGSTSDSVIVLSRLHQLSIRSYQFAIVAVVTQPPRPVGRKQIMTPTPVETWAKEQGITVLSFPSLPDRPYLFAHEPTVSEALEPLKADLLVTASFGQKIPSKIIGAARFGGLNVHPSILPRFRGADPVPWAIVSGDRQTGVSVVTLAEKFDAGRIIGQKKVTVSQRDFPDPLRSKLFTIGAELLVYVLPDYLSGKNKGKPQLSDNLIKEPYARRLTRADGFEPWEALKAAFETGAEASRLERKFRAFHPWPGLWTKVKINGQEKRLKILEVDTRDQRFTISTVQLEGKNPVPFSTFRKAYPV